MEQDEIIIRQGIVHILDGELGCPVFSEQLLELTPDINDFFRQHIFKIMSGDENLVNSSKEMAGLLYSIMNSNITIPSADFAAVTFQFKSVLYLALLKMNYKESFVHMTNSSEGSNVNSIIKYKAALPASSAKLSEAVIINLEDYTVNIVEKKQLNRLIKSILQKNL